MTLTIDLERVAAVTARLQRHRATTTAIGEHLARLGARMHLDAEVAPGVVVAERLTDQIGFAATLLTRRAEQARQADQTGPADTSVGGDELRSFAGGTALCSVIQVVSPIPARPSTSGVTGAIDAAGVARDVGSLADTAAGGAALAGRSAPIATIAAAIADTVLCRLGVGSGAPISTRTTVDADGKQIYEGSRSPHRFHTANGEPLDTDPERRDRQMWRVEHSNQNGLAMEPYPGFPAYEVNAPKRRP